MFLDYAATTPLSFDMKNYIFELLDYFYNPSSTYQNGLNVKNIIENSRNSVAKFINCEPENVVFTSSGSASNTLGIKGYFQRHDCCILYSPIAHKSILECVKSHTASYPLKVDSCGNVDIKHLEWLLDNTYYKPFIVIDLANSEIGTIQNNILKIIELVHFYNGIIMLDCTAYIPHFKVDSTLLNADMLTFSAHKLGALKGCGVLYKKSDIELEPIVYGNQENGLFGGTENVLSIASTGKAVNEFIYIHTDFNRCKYVYDFINKNIENSYLVGEIFENRLPNNLFICFKGIVGESLMTLLDMNNIQVSTGSACSSGSLTPSEALLAIGINNKDINSCIRITLLGKETIDELNYFCSILKKCVEQLRSFT